MSRWTWDRLGRFIAARLDPASDLGLRLTINITLFCASVWAFSGLLEDVLENESLVRWDFAVHERWHDRATALGLRLWSAVTAIGSVGVWTVVPIVAVWLFLRRDRVLLLGWLGTNLGGLLVQHLLKAIVHRTRPQYSAAYLHGHSYSFPSGHAMGTAICFTALVYVVSTTEGWSRRRRTALYGASLVIVLAVAFSRVYLGVHYPSDVLGGMAAGLAWAVACITAMQFARRR